jgi:RHS repeat-associated protein
METFCAIANRSCKCSTFGARPSWSSALLLDASTTLAPNCSINRYYDSATDSFISVDPDLQTTDQAYVFTNDDPLDATDPLGLQGGAGVEAEVKYTEAVHKKCDGHPEKSGCQGLNVVKILTSIASATTDAISNLSSALNHGLTEGASFLNGALLILQNSGDPPAKIIGGVIGNVLGTIAGAFAGGFFGASQSEDEFGPESVPFGTIAGVFGGGALGGYEGSKIGMNYGPKIWQALAKEF